MISFANYFSGSWREWIFNQQFDCHIDSQLLFMTER
jgi:hypothetical protein